MTDSRTHLSSYDEGRVDERNRILDVIDRHLAELQPVGEWDVEDRRISAVLRDVRAEIDSGGGELTGQK